jgi:hypothetical protein
VVVWAAKFIPVPVRVRFAATVAKAVPLTLAGEYATTTYARDTAFVLGKYRLAGLAALVIEPFDLGLAVLFPADRASQARGIVRQLLTAV